MRDPIIYTVGHSTRSYGELIDLLGHYGVDTLIDIRSIPYSRYNPQFNLEEMQAKTAADGLRYEHWTALGGRQPSREVMAGAKSCSERSRGFAEHMQTPAFKGALDHVLGLAQAGATLAMMCGERDPEHCHRYWVADAVQERGFIVRHIVWEDDLREHPANLFTYL